MQVLLAVKGKARVLQAPSQGEPGGRGCWERSRVLVTAALVAAATCPLPCLSAAASHEALPRKLGEAASCGQAWRPGPPLRRVRWLLLEVRLPELMLLLLVVEVAVALALALLLWQLRTRRGGARVTERRRRLKRRRQRHPQELEAARVQGRPPLHAAEVTAGYSHSAPHRMKWQWQQLIDRQVGEPPVAVRTEYPLRSKAPI